MRKVLISLLLIAGGSAYAQHIPLRGTFRQHTYIQYSEAYTFLNDSVFSYSSSGCTGRHIGQGTYALVGDTLLTLHFQQMEDPSFSFTYQGLNDPSLKEQTVVIKAYLKDTLHPIQRSWFGIYANGYRNAQKSALNDSDAVAITIPYYLYDSINEVGVESPLLNKEYYAPLYHNKYNRHQYTITIHTDTAISFVRPETRQYTIRRYTGDMFYVQTKPDNPGAYIVYLKDDVPQNNMTREYANEKRKSEEIYNLLNKSVDTR